MKKGYAAQRQFVGVDLACRRSVIARMDQDGGALDCVQIDNSAKELVAEVAKAGAGALVAVEATYGWYWAVDALEQAGHEVHLAHPKGNASMRNRRVKTDARDAAELARLLRMGDLAESWIAPPRSRGPAGAGPASAQAGQDPVGAQGERACGAGQVRGVVAVGGHLRPGRAQTAGRDRAARAIRLPGCLALPADRGDHPRGGPGRGGDRRVPLMGRHRGPAQVDRA